MTASRMNCALPAAGSTFLPSANWRRDRAGLLPDWLQRVDLTSGAPVRQHEAVALCEMCAAGAAAAFLRVTVIEHGKALIAEPPLCLGGRRARNVMRQTEVMTGAALSTVTVATAGAASLTGGAVEEHFLF